MGVRLPSRGFAHDQLVIGGQTHGCVVGFDAHGAGAVGGMMGSRRPPDGFFTYGRGVLPKLGRRCGTTVFGVVFTIRFANGEGTV